ncbi:MAG: RNA polymerase sigma factor, partial [Chitinispirillaceae bacterium]
YELRSEMPYECWVDLNAPDEMDDITRREFKQEVGRVLRTVTPEQKAAFTLYYFAGCRGKEAAEIMHVSEANFFMKLKAARDTLRSRLSKKGWGL